LGTSAITGSIAKEKQACAKETYGMVTDENEIQRVIFHKNRFSHVLDSTIFNNPE